VSLAVRGWRLPAASGVLLGAGYFNLPFPFVNFVAFLPLLAWLDAEPRPSRGEVLRAGVVFGLSAHLLALHWVWAMLSISWLASLMYLALAAGFTLFIMVSVRLASWMRERTGGSYGWILPVSWIPLEWLRSFGDLRMTADHLGHSIADHPFLVQFADVLGPYGVGAFVLASNGLLFDAWLARRRPRLRAAAALGLLWAAVLGYDAWAWGRDWAGAGTIRVGYVQPNIPLEQKHDPAEEHRIRAILDMQTREAAAAGAQLVVWPESARPTPLYHRVDLAWSYAMPDVQALARDTRTTILAGVEYVRIRRSGDYELYNAAVAVRPDGTLEPSWAAKTYLVPFVERTPFMPVLGPLLSGDGDTLRWLSGRFEPGRSDGLVPVGGTRAGILVCYEELYPDLARRQRRAGARLLAVITNDAWFGRTFFQAYQANALALRAIENRVSIVRAANTGISGFVDPRGTYHERSGLFVPDVRVADLPLTERATPYTRWGDVVAWACTAALVVLGLALLRRERAVADSAAEDRA
jgi:apolipoprotein N-acyltransferase